MKRDWDIVTSYIDHVGTSDKTVLFPKPQDSVKVTNKGNTNLIYTIGTKSGTLAPNGSVTVNEVLTNFSLRAETDRAEYEVRATEAGTDQEENTPTLPSDVAGTIEELQSSLAQKVSLSEQIKGTSGKKYKVVACILRNEGSGWYAIQDVGHEPVNILSVTNDSLAINVTFDFTASKICSFVATPDEYLAEQGYFMGSSVVKDGAVIKLGRQFSLGDYVYYDEATSTFKNAGGNATLTGIESMVWRSVDSTLVITHKSVSGAIASVNSRDGSNIPVLGSVSATTTEIKFKNYDGTGITTPSANMKVFFTRNARNIVNPQSVSAPSLNIWCYGIFEV
jgi:hypothetical protein